MAETCSDVENSAAIFVRCLDCLRSGDKLVVLEISHKSNMASTTARPVEINIGWVFPWSLWWRQGAPLDEWPAPCREVSWAFRGLAHCSGVSQTFSEGASSSTSTPFNLPNLLAMLPETRGAIFGRHFSAFTWMLNVPSFGSKFSNVRRKPDHTSPKHKLH